jgi:hypothetical protein
MPPAFSASRAGVTPEASGHGSSRTFGKNMKSASILLLLVALSFSIANGAPIDDLASPDQAIRDKAAAELQLTFKDTPETKWTSTVDKIKKGQTKKEILALLRPFNVKEEGGAGSGQSHSQSYRLDDEWILVCWFQNDGDVLIGRKLDRSLRHIWIAPAKNFSGLWVTYFVNGHKSHQINYIDGQYLGEFIAYRADGSKAYVQHYSLEGADGDDTGYYPSGSVSYRAQYRAGKPIGTWNWYDEDGKVTSTREHPNP